MINCEFENGDKAHLRHVAVHCIVVDSGKILLEKRAENLVEGGKWSLPGGFVDLNETTEMAAHRELLEETGWVADITGLLRINSNPKRLRDDRQIICFDFIMMPIKKTGDSDHEVTELKWFDMDSLPLPEQIAFDHNESIDIYRRYEKDRFDIPLWKTSIFESKNR